MYSSYKFIFVKYNALTAKALGHKFQKIFARWSFFMKYIRRFIPELKNYSRLNVKTINRDNARWSHSQILTKILKTLLHF